MQNSQCQGKSYHLKARLITLTETLTVLHITKTSFNNKQLLDSVFVICRIIDVEVRIISRAEDEADNSF